MKIRKEQMEAFSQGQEEAFMRRMVTHLRDDFGKERLALSIPESALEDLVRQGMESARGYDVIYTRDVKLYLECLVILGPKFDRDRKIPWAREILRDQDRDGRAKMDEIHDHLLFGQELGT